MTNYRQCLLRKGDTYQVSYIAEKFAKMHKYLKLKENGIWEDGWQVMTVGNLLSEEALNIQQEQVRNTRKASDI